MKLSLEDKMTIVKFYEEGYSYYVTIVRKFNVLTSTVEKIIRRYKMHGIESLKHPPKQQVYSPEFKMKIIKLVFERKSKTSLVAEYNITGSAGTIVAWMHKYEELGYNGII